MISHHETKRKSRFDPYIIQRQIFFDGVVYIIEEEIHPDSDISSCDTSDDSFDDGLSKQLQSKLRRGKWKEWKGSTKTDTHKSMDFVGPKTTLKRLNTIGDDAERSSLDANTELPLQNT